jgi:outer membrane protein assembly factor BamA
MIRQRIRAFALGLASISFLLGGVAKAFPGEEGGKPRDPSTVVILPVFFYTPETKMAGGVGGLLAFHPAWNPDGGRPTAISFYAIYTQLKQFSMKIEPEIYLGRENYLLKGKFGFERYPNKFWGYGDDAPATGEEGYTPRKFTIEASLMKKIVPRASLYGGVQVVFESLKILRSDAGGRIAAGSVAGARGGTIVGLGFILNRDSRDNIFYPRKGDYWVLTTVFNGKFLGGEFAYTSLRLDLRKFIPLSASGVLAIQGLVKAVGGVPPFYHYAQFGGDSMMRGYYTGRYADKIMAAVQAEYRMTLSGRFGAVGFAGLGNVAPRLGAFDFLNPKPSIGAGLRFRISRNEATNLRLDFALGRGSSGFYFTANEAF